MPSTSKKRHRPHVALDKRKRAVRACISCRDSKKKCILSSENLCQSCARYGLVCVFEPIPKDRNDTLSQKPLKWSDPAVWDTITRDVSKGLQEKFPGLNLDSKQFSIVARLFQEAIGRNEQGVVSESGSPGEESSTSLHRTPQTNFNIESQPTGPSTAGVIDTTPSTSHASFLAAVSDTISPVHVKGRDSPVHLSNLTQEEDDLTLLTILSQLPPRGDAEALVDVFFTFLESNWYYFDERWFRNLLAEVYMNKDSSPQQVSCTTTCLVLLVLALASTFEHLFKQTILLNSGQQIPGSTFFVQAMKLMTRVIASHSVESAMCCLLTSLYLLAMEDISHHHVYMGIALNLTVGLSLHRNGAGNDETPQDHEMKVRLFWTIYSIERQTSLIMGLPTTLQLKDITVSLPQRQQDLDRNGSQRVDRLIAFTKLTMIADEIINAGPIEQSSTTYDWACSKLESSKQLVPARSLVTQEASFRANAHLDIMYNMIWVNIGRGASLRLVRKRLYPATADMTNQEHDEIYHRSQNLVERCTDAAKLVVDRIHQLHSRNLLARFSFTDFHTCSSAVIVLLLNTLLRPPYNQLQPISLGIDALRFMADGSKLAMNALRLVERLQEGVQKATGMAHKEDTLDPQPHSIVPVSRDLSQSGTVNLGPYTGTLDNTTCDNTGLEITPLDLTLFADLEPSLLEYSEQDLTLFGFDGFGSMFDQDFIL